MESHKWETISESMESVERNVNKLRQTDIHIHLRDKSFRLWDPLWDPFEEEKWCLSDSSPTRIRLWEIIFP